MGRTYTTVKDGERFRIPCNERIACCDCGLVHRWEITVVKKGRHREVYARTWRDPKATGGVRAALFRAPLKERRR